MKITRGENSISYSDEKGSGAIGKMKAAKSYDDEIVDAWLKHCVKLIQPNVRSFEETEQFLYEHYDVEPLDLGGPPMRNFKSSVLISHFADRLEHKPSEFSFEMTDEEIGHWRNESDAQRKEALDAPPEQFGLKLHGYRLLRTERSVPLIEADQRKLEQQTGKKCSDLNEPECFIFWEEKSGVVSGHGFGCFTILREACIFHGVAQEDIDGLTPRFMAYIGWMAEKGEVPGLKEFAGRPL